MTSEGPAAEVARADLRAFLDAKGHPTDIGAAAADRLERALEEGALARTPELERMLADLHLALERDEGQRLGGKSAEAARFILRAIVRESERA